MHGLQAAGGTRPLSYRPLLLAAASVVLVDQVTKSLALEHLAGGPIHLVDGILSLRLTFNAGGAFGILQSVPWLFVITGLVIVVGILVSARHLDDRTPVAPLGVVLGGGVGNLVDRIVRDHAGRVVDFIDLHVWPVFNIADAAIVIGAGVLLWQVRGAGEPARDGAPG